MHCVHSDIPDLATCRRQAEEALEADAGGACGASLVI
jgi:hypothetical protein